MKNKFLNTLKSLFFSGLFTILPIVLTIYLFLFTFRLLAHWFKPLQYITPVSLQYLSPYAEFVFVLAFIFAIGIISKLFILKGIIHWLESLVMRIPLVRPVYHGIKQLVHALTHSDKVSGFGTGVLPSEIAPSTEEVFHTVFIPTTPTPTTGYLISVTEKELIKCSMNRQEAMALVISGGIIHPDKFVQDKEL